MASRTVPALTPESGLARPARRDFLKTVAALTAYVELIRGTPILLQLFVLYYGIAAAIRLPAFMAALLCGRHFGRDRMPRVSKTLAASRAAGTMEIWQIPVS